MSNVGIGQYTPPSNPSQIVDATNTSRVGKVSVYGEQAATTDVTKPTFRAGLTAQTLFSTSAAVLVELTGSATATIRIKKIRVWGQTATKFFTELTLLRCTGVSAGTPNVVTIGKQDVNSAAATAVLNNYTAAAAAGAGSVVTGAAVMAVSPPTAGLSPIATVWDFSRNSDQAMILRGAGDVLQVFNNITGLGAGTYGFEIQWEEHS